MNSRTISQLKKEIKALANEIEELYSNQPFLPTTCRNNIFTLGTLHEKLGNVFASIAEDFPEESDEKIESLNKAKANYLLAEKNLAEINKQPRVAFHLNRLDVLHQLALNDKYRLQHIKAIQAYLEDPIFLAKVKLLKNKGVIVEDSNLFYVAEEKIKELQHFCQYASPKTLKRKLHFFIGENEKNKDQKHERKTKKARVDTTYQPGF